MSGITYETKNLKNGVPVLFAHYPDGQTVTMGVSFNVGGRNEWKREKSFDGISHFLEHQFFKGNDNMTPHEVHERLDDLGGMTNAFTTKPVTAYFTKSLKEEIDASIEMWSELLNYGKIRQEEFDREAFVVRQEFRRGEDNPIQYLFRRLGSQLHEGTSLEMDVIGSEESLSTVTLEQMESYREEHYDLVNAVIMVLGNFDKDDVYAKLNASFGKRKVSDTKPQQQLTSYTPPSKTDMQVFRYDKASPLALLGMGIKTPGGKSEDYYALDILKAYLTLGKSSVLQEKMVRSGISAFAFAIDGMYEDIGDLLLIVGAPPPMVEQAHAGMIHMLHEVLSMEVTTEMLAEICDRIEYDERSGGEEPIMVLFNQSLGYWARGKFESPDEYLAGIRSVTIDQYNAVRQKVLGNLEGVYLMMGSIGEFFPSFPEGTYSGEFH
ncbi:MAG: insulinase family protein [Candidatus Heimdallarchaeota archaeon]|nr:insulinase family protein [Candidatus Heimdallarchaeota archaeon]